MQSFNICSSFSGQRDWPPWAGSELWGAAGCSPRPERLETRRSSGHTQPYEPVPAVERRGQSCVRVTPAAVLGKGQDRGPAGSCCTTQRYGYLGQWQQAWREGNRCERIFKDVEQTEGHMTQRIPPLVKTRYEQSLVLFSSSNQL